MKHLKKHGFLLLTILWTCIIFGFSLQSGDESILTSNIVVDLLAILLPGLKDPAHLSLVVLIIRKTAHFTEYFILGYFTTKAYHENGYKGILMVGWFIPILDETLQLFSPGRVSSPVDMLIDMAGYLTALILFGSIKVFFGIFKKNWTGK
jgi:VanZ family protein